MQNRSTARSHRGGDTVLMERLASGLERKGVEVTIDLEMKEDPAQYDLVHLFNFALPQLLEIQGRRAHGVGTPFVVSTLYEDIPCFHNQSLEWGRCLVEYVRRGQDRAWFDTERQLLQYIPAPRFENDWVAKNAAALYTNGKGESETVRRDYGPAVKVVETTIGYDAGQACNAEDFVQQFGVRDFIFCVGRIETRKNQLMLLKALEDVDLPIVLAGGGFTYQPDYDQAVRNFKRKGQTLVLDKLTPEMLGSAYMACRMHVLPSWYELPGLVSLEAAHYGKNVVVTDAGTSADYFGDWAFYCDPASPRSILNAVLAAYHSPAKSGLSGWVSQYTWESAVEKTYSSYCSITGLSPRAAASGASVSVSGHYDLDSGETDFQELLERGEMAAQQRQFDIAIETLAKAEKLNLRSVKLQRSLGAVHLANSNPETAREYFSRAIDMEPNDSKSLSGLGMCEMMMKNPEKAYDLFLRSLSIKADELVPILQLLECSYMLERFDDLERVLRQFVSDHPSDIEMKYCLAGCLFKMKAWDEAEKLNEEILAHNSSHRGALELKTAIADNRPVETPPVKEESSIAPPAVDLQGMLSRLIEKKIEERGVSETSSAPAVEPNTAFSGTDTQLVFIEEKKRGRNYQEALDDVEKLLQQQSLSQGQWEKALILKGDLLASLGDLEAAGQLYDDVLHRNPRSARAITARGAITAARGNWAEGKHWFEEALTVDPEFDLALAGMGLWAQAQSRSEEAWNYYRRALAKNPENTRALLGVIELGYSLRRLEAVEEVINGYLDMHPGDLDFIYALAGCYFAQNRIDEARAEVEKVTLFQPNHEKALELKGLIESRLGGG